MKIVKSVLDGKAAKFSAFLIFLSPFFLGGCQNFPQAVHDTESAISAADSEIAYGRCKPFSRDGYEGRAIKMEKGDHAIFYVKHIPAKTAELSFRFLPETNQGQDSIRFSVGADGVNMETVEFPLDRKGADAKNAAKGEMIVVPVSVPLLSDGVHKLTFIALSDGIVLDGMLVRPLAD